MKLRSLLVAFALVSFGQGAARAQMVSLALNDNAFDAWGGFYLGRDDASRVLLGGRYLYADDEDTKYPAFLVAFAGRPDAMEEVSFHLGVQGVFAEASNLDVEAIAVGGFGEWVPKNWKGVYLGARLFYAPEVFSFDDTEGIFEYAARGGYVINEKFQAFLEYSEIEAEIAVLGDVSVDDGVKIGFEFGF
jgi:hypothetical protein